MFGDERLGMKAHIVETKRLGLFIWGEKTRSMHPSIF
jgi:hypothetical protein